MESYETRKKAKNKIESVFFQLKHKVSILQYGCTTWTLTKRMEKKLDNNCTRIASYIELIKKAASQKQLLYGNRYLISRTIQIRRTRHAGHCWRFKHELSSDFLLWIPSGGQANVGQQARTYNSSVRTHDVV